MDTLSTVKTRFQLATSNQEKRFEKFNDFDYVFHSRLKYFDPNVPARVFNPIIWSFIETIVTRMLVKDPIIGYKPRKVADVAQAKILSELFSYWFQKTEAYPIIVSWVKDALIYGTGIVKMDWYTSPPRMVKSYALDPAGQPIVGEDGNFIVEETPVVDMDDPRLTNVNIYDFFFDPKATSLNNAKWVIHQYWADISDLEAANETSKEFGKVIYNKSALRRIKDGTGKTSESNFEEQRRRAAGNDMGSREDKTVNRIKIWEMWENNRCVVIGNESEILRDETNYYWHGKKPFIHIVDSIVPNEFYGKGEIEPVEKMLHALNTTQNQRITNVNRILNPTWKAKEGIDDSELQFTDNNVIHVTEMDDVDLQEMPDVTSKAYQEQQAIIEQMQRALGVTDITQGLNTPSATAAEVQIKTSQSNERFAHKIKIFEEMGLQNLGEMVYKLYQQFTTKSRVIRVTGRLGEQYITMSPADLVGDFDVIPESNSTLESDRDADFRKFLDLFNILQPYVKTSVPDPVTGEVTETGFIDEMELVKELLNRSGEKDPERYFGQNQAVPGAIPGQTPQTPGVPAQPPVQPVQGSQGVPGANPNAGLEAILGQSQGIS